MDVFRFMFFLIMTNTSPVKRGARKGPRGLGTELGTELFVHFSLIMTNIIKMANLCDSKDPESVAKDTFSGRLVKRNHLRKCEVFRKMWLLG